jgi:hypothetical protein
MRTHSYQLNKQTERSHLHLITPQQSHPQISPLAVAAVHLALIISQQQSNPHIRHPLRLLLLSIPPTPLIHLAMRRCRTMHSQPTRRRILTVRIAARR